MQSNKPDLTTPLCLCGVFDRDTVTFSQYCQYVAERHLLQHAKKLFMRTHALTLYASLTQDYRLNLNLNQLLNGLSEHLPDFFAAGEDGDERRKQEYHDESAGIFFWGVLAQPKSGNHLIESMLMPTARAQQLLSQFVSESEVTLEKLTLTRQGHTGHITFRNPDSLNAEDNALIRDMETAVDLVYLNPQIKVAVLRGGVVNHPKYVGKRIFSAGINLKHLHQQKISFVDFLLGRELGYISKMIRGIRLTDELDSSFLKPVEKPWLSVVDTFAIGGGMQLLLASDQVIGESGSYVSLPAAKEGIVPGVANLRLTAMTNERLAKQVILQGRRIWANEEDAKLLYDSVVESDQLDGAIAAAVDALAAPAVTANKRMLLIGREPVDLFRQYMSEFALQQCERLFSTDVHNKVSQFTTKT